MTCRFSRVGRLVHIILVANLLSGRPWPFTILLFYDFPVPFYSSSAAFCLLRSHHVLLVRLVASDCLSCLAAFGHSLSSLLLSLSLHVARILPSSSVLLYSARNLSFSLPRGNFCQILRSSGAAVTPGHPHQSLCPVCVGVQRRE